MAALTSPVPLRDQADLTASIVIPIVTKQTPGLAAASAQLVAAVNAGATSLVIQLPDAIANPLSAKPFPGWVTTAANFRIDTGAVAETLTVSGVAIAGTIATLTCTATTYAHAVGANVQITELVGAAATSTFTFAAQQFNTANRGIVLELLDLLDRALREGSATVA